MIGRSEVQEGMAVYGRSGVRLGRVFAVGEEDFHVEKGLLFPRDFLCSFADVREVRAGALILDVDRLATFEQGRPGRLKDVVASPEPPEVRVPLATEALDVHKRERVSGLRIKREVVQETKTVTVPVRREVLRAERVAANPDERQGERSDLRRAEEPTATERRADPDLDPQSRRH